MTFEKAVENVKKYVKEHFPKNKDSDNYFYVGEVGGWWCFTACGPNGEGLTGALRTLVSKETGETAFSCWPNSIHPVEKENKYTPLNNGEPLKIHI